MYTCIYIHVYVRTCTCMKVDYVVPLSHSVQLSCSLINQERMSSYTCKKCYIHFLNLLYYAWSMTGISSLFIYGLAHTDLVLWAVCGTESCVRGWGWSGSCSTSLWPWMALRVSPTLSPTAWYMYTFYRCLGGCEKCPYIITVCALAKKKVHKLYLDAKLRMHNNLCIR